jgi:hypothetical protein
MVRNILRPGTRRLGALVLAGSLLASGCGVATTALSTSLGLAALVQHGAEATLSRKTADMTVTGTINVAGHAISMTGTGESDFAAHAMKLDAQMDFGGQQASIHELVVGGHLYMGFSAAGESMKKMTGYDWWELPIPATGSAGSGLGDPTEMLALAAHDGSKVVSLGTTTVNGLQVEGFAVTPSRAAMIAGAKSRMGSLSAEQRALVERGLKTMTPPTIKVWFDKTENLVRRMVVKMNLPIGGTNSGGTVQFDFSNYGAPVSITAPPAGDVSTKMPGQ